jgi:succinyl-CoA synthetase beta subunit
MRLTLGPVLPEWKFVFSQVFTDCDFTLMEMNPFTLESGGAPFPLDMRWAVLLTAAL